MDIKKFKIDFKNPAVIGLIISLAVFIIIIAAYYYLIYSGLNAALSRKEASLNGVRAKYNAYLILVSSEPALVKQQKAINRQFAGLVAELPSKKDIQGLLMKISNYEKLLSLNLKMFKPEKVTPKGFYEAIPFSMNISGDFYNVYKFFYKLASMKRIVDVHNVSIAKGSKGQMVSVSFKGTTFSFVGTPPSPVKPVKKTGGVIKK